jgi:putative acetyltransferase
MMAQAHPKLALRPFLPADAPLAAEIFRASIEELTGDDYSASQQEAWAAMADDVEEFGARLANSLTLLGTIDGSPVGFASLEGQEFNKDTQARVDMLYVHPAAAGHGVGTMLIDALEKLAAARGAGKLSADVSDSAEGFFKRRGFVPQQRNSVPLGNEWLANTTMEKQLAAKAAKEQPQ